MNETYLETSVYVWPEGTKTGFGQSPLQGQEVDSPSRQYILVSLIFC